VELHELEPGKVPALLFGLCFLGHGIVFRWLFCW
jgi:hypothetical protein